MGGFEPPGKSNVRSSFQWDDDAALIGTEETGDLFKTTDGETLGGKFGTVARPGIFKMGATTSGRRMAIST